MAEPAAEPPKVATRETKLVLTAEEKLERQTKAIGKIIRGAIKSKRSLGGKAVKNIAGVFKAIDKDGSGDLDHAEFKKAMDRLGLGLTEEQIVQCIEVLDKDGDGEVSLDEFMALVKDEVKVTPKRSEPESEPEPEQPAAEQGAGGAAPAPIAIPGLPAELGVLTLPSPHRDAAALSAAAAHQYLALVPLLAAMPALERRSLCGRLHVSRFEKAEPLVRQGSDNTGELYILLTGVLKVTIDGTDRWWLKPGASFGGGGSAARPWAATVVAEGGEASCALLLGDDPALSGAQQASPGFFRARAKPPTPRGDVIHGALEVGGGRWPVAASPRTARRPQRGGDPDERSRRDRQRAVGPAARLSGTLESHLSSALVWSGRENGSRATLCQNGPRPVGYGGTLSARPRPPTKAAEAITLSSLTSHLLPAPPVRPRPLAKTRLFSLG